MFNQEPLISIIMPVYNVETYLENSISSVLNQTFANFELILVNDGSTDQSGEICETCALMDSRIRVVHQTNKGVSAARNRGVEAAKGLFIGFVDGDDWIEPDFYQLLYDNSLAYDAEISACGFIKVSDYEKIKFTSSVAPTCRYTPEQALKAMLTQNHMRYSVCNKLFKRTIFETVRFPEGRWIEDKTTTYKMIHNCQSIAWCPSPKYHYFLRAGSVSHTEFHDKYVDFFKANDELMVFVKTHYPRLKKLVGVCYAAESLRILQRMKKASYKDDWVYETCKSYILQNWWRSLITSSIDFETKKQILGFLLNPNGLKCDN